VYPSILSADEVLQAYGLMPGIPLHDLHHCLLQFANDVTFGYPIYRAKKFLATYQPKTGGYDGRVGDRVLDHAFAQSIHHTTVRSYRVEFGNPFPGPNHNVAHHCVDMIYLFDAFHDALLSVDRSCQSSEPPQNEHVEALPLPISTADSGYVSAADSPHAKHNLEESPSTTSPHNTNTDLVLTMQTHWIKFIVGEGNSRTKDSGQNGIGDFITVYGKDRAVSVENFLHDPKWVEEWKRYEVLELHPLEMKQVHKKITHSVLA
jgi:hypothetical protein